MKVILIASIVAVLAAGMSGKAEAHGYPATGGSFIWADDGVVIGLNYGGPYARPYFVPPRYVYGPRHGYREAWRHGRHHGHGRSYRKGNRHGHGKSYRKGHGRGHRHDRGHGHHGHRRDH